jgi:hypothetical protein
VSLRRITVGFVGEDGHYIRIGAPSVEGLGKGRSRRVRELVAQQQDTAAPEADLEQGFPFRAHMHDVAADRGENLVSRKGQIRVGRDVQNGAWAAIHPASM